MNNELVKLDLDLDNDVGANTLSGVEMSGLEPCPVWRSSWTIYHRADRRCVGGGGAGVVAHFFEQVDERGAWEGESADGVDVGGGGLRGAWG